MVRILIIGPAWVGVGLIGAAVHHGLHRRGSAPSTLFFLEKDAGAIQAWQVGHAGRAYQALSEAVEEVSLRRTRIASLIAYAGILPDYRKTLDSMDAMLRELEELRSRIEGLLEE
ncbi:MAG: hypothetical protein ACP5IE_08375 [Infirmifilum sp.]